MPVDGSVRVDLKVIPNMPHQHRMLGGFNVPLFLYGTAWKEDETQRLTALALRSGFRGIDTANQRKHYHEAGVGAGIAEVSREGLVRRDDLFLQTKFTFRDGQDHRLPYDPNATIAEQVEQSFASSLEHLGVSYIDSYVLHGPSRHPGLGQADLDAWRAMEAIHDRGLVRFLGISNVDADQLQGICGFARIRPRFVQNRCYAVRGWDRAVRSLGNDLGIVNQGFSLLTANRGVLQHPSVLEIARRHGRTVCQTVFRFALDVGMIALTGTTNSAHMTEDLGALEFQLQPDEVSIIENLARR
jgi:diketogulonate reductase-like aldo/keto reductase